MKNIPVTGKKFLSQKWISCHRKKIQVKGILWRREVKNNKLVDDPQNAPRNILLEQQGQRNKHKILKSLFVFILHHIFQGLGTGWVKKPVTLKISLFRLFYSLFVNFFSQYPIPLYKRRKMSGQSPLKMPRGLRYLIFQGNLNFFKTLP